MLDAISFTTSCPLISPYFYVISFILLRICYNKETTIYVAFCHLIASLKEQKLEDNSIPLTL